MANRTISVAGGNWNANATWLEGSPPDATMDVIATAASGPVTINTTTCVCKTLILTGYLNTMTFTSGQTLTVSGTVTFVAGMTLTGTGTLAINIASTITSGGLTFPGNLTFSLSDVTYTLGDNWTVTGTTTVGVSGGVTITVNSNILRCNGSLTCVKNLAGTATVRMGGTGTLSTSSSAIVIANNLTINTAGTITLGTNIGYQTGTFTYTAGTIVNTGSTLTIRGSCTLDTNTMHWGSISFLVAGTYTLSSALVLDATLNIAINGAIFSGAFNISTVTFTISSTCTFSGDINISGNMTIGGTVVTTGNFKFNISGNFTITGTLNITGTMIITMVGTGTVQCGTTGGSYNQTPGVINCPFTINTAGTITFSTVFAISSSTTLTYTAGTLDFTTNNSLLYMGANMNIPVVSGFTWNGLLFRENASRVYTMTQNWTFAGDIVVLLGGNASAFITASIAGSFNMQCRNLIVYGGQSFTFTATQTLTVTTGMYMGGQNVTAYSNSGAIVQSGTASTAFNLKYQGTLANNKVYGVTFTDVNASTSTQPVINWNGATLTRTTNINNVNLPVTLASTGVSS